jgi:hypothetical protein
VSTGQLAITDAQWGMLATTTVAIVSLVGQLLMGATERRHQREQEELSRAHEDEVRRRTTLQERRGELYPAVLSDVHHTLARLRSAERISDVGQLVDDDAIDLRSRAGAVADEAVRVAFDAWLEVVSEIDRLVRSARAGTSETGWSTFQDLRERAGLAASRLEGAIGGELGEI